MLITFSEQFTLPVEEVFSYFASPADWARLYGSTGVRDLGSGWFAVGIKGFPFPLVAKSTEVETDRLVRWTFRGFWRGEGGFDSPRCPNACFLRAMNESRFAGCSFSHQSSSVCF